MSEKKTIATNRGTKITERERDLHAAITGFVKQLLALHTPVVT